MLVAWIGFAALSAFLLVRPSLSDFLPALDGFGHRLAFMFALFVLFAFAGPQAEARRVAAAVAMDARTGEVLYSRSGDVIAYPASLTKMMTLYLTFEAIEQGRLSFNTKLTVSKRAAGMPASKLGLKRGSTIRVKDAVLSLITKSANDAAVVLAEALGDSEIRFAQLMTKKARSLGMQKTSFRNASGLTNRHQKTTARDMAKLARRLILDFPGRYSLFATQKFSWGKRTYRSTNKLLGNVRGVDGLKTGYTSASGFNLAASAKRNGHRIVAIVLGGKSGRARDNRMRQVLDRGFELQRGMILAGSVKPVMKPTIDAVLASLEEPAGQDVSVQQARIENPVQTAQLAVTPKFGAKPVISENRATLVTEIIPEQRPQTSLAASVDKSEPSAERMTLVWNGRRAIIEQSVATEGPFSVQVGAYHDPELAKNAAIRAVKKLPSTLSLNDIKITPRKGRKRPVYQARLEGFSKDVADRTCRLLKMQNNDCFVIRTASS